MCIDGRTDRFRIIILTGTTRRFINTRCEITVLRMRACLGLVMRAGLPQNLAPEANANHSPAGGREERANTCLHNIDVFLSLSLDPSPCCRSNHSSHPNCILWCTRDSTEPCLSRSFPRSFAGKLQIGDFRGSADPRDFPFRVNLLQPFCDKVVGSGTATNANACRF